MEIVESNIEYANYTVDELNTIAKISCRRARSFEDAGSFSAAESVMNPFWNGVGTIPQTEKLEEEIKAEVLLRAGVITGWIGDNKSIPHSQEWAKDLISQSNFIFENLNSAEKSAEAQVEIATCYWREGAFDEARIFLSTTIEKIKYDDAISNDIKALTYLRRAVIENDEGRFREAVYYLKNGDKFFEASENASLKGKYHNQMGIALQSIGDLESDPDYLDRALIEYAAAGIYFQEAGHKRYGGFVENNIGMVYLSLKNFAEAHEHFQTAGKFFANLKEKIFVAQVEESIAKALIGQNLLPLAEKTALQSVEIFERAERFALMIESLTTLGVALSRMKKFEQAQIQFLRAEEIAIRMTLPNLAGMAILTLLEEQKSQLSAEEFVDYYNKTVRYFGNQPQIESLKRLQKIAAYFLNEKFEMKAARSGIDSKTSAEMINYEEKIREIINNSQVRYQKTVNFTADSVTAMVDHFLDDNFGRLEKFIEQTIKKSENGALITSDAVEVVALRNSMDADFAFPWKNLSLRELTQSIEKRLIQLALKVANGKITEAARLLGFKHYEMLHSIIKSRHPELLVERTPLVKRRKSIIKKSK